MQDDVTHSNSEKATNLRHNLVQYEPLVVEKCALPAVKKATEIWITSTTKIYRRRFEDTSREICLRGLSEAQNLYGHGVLSGVGRPTGAL